MAAVGHSSPMSWAVELSPGTLEQSVHQAAAQVEPVVAAIKATLLTQPARPK